jgi:phage shock protein A
MSTDEKLEQLRRQHGQEIADLRYKLGRLETEVQRLRQAIQRAKP